MLPYITVIQFSLHLVQIPDFAIGKIPATHHNKNPSMLYSGWDTDGCISFTNSSLQLNPLILPKDFELILCAIWPPGAF